MAETVDTFPINIPDRSVFSADNEDKKDYGNNTEPDVVIVHNNKYNNVRQIKNSDDQE